MALSLEEYARLHPQEQPQREREAMAAQAETLHDRQQRREDADRLKEVILQQLEKGQDPQTVLYTALQCIGLLSNDTEWAEAGQKCLDKVFSDLAQQSLLIDNEAVAAQRLDTMQSQYNDKLRRQLNRQLAGYRRIETALREALAAVNDLDPEEPVTIL